MLIEHRSLLADGNVHKCSPALLIGLKCPFKLNLQGVEITAATNSAERWQSCRMRALVVYKAKPVRVLVNPLRKGNKKL